LAPEVFRGTPRSRLSDVYSLGVLLFHLVTNEYPIDGATRADVEEAHDRGARTRLRDLRPDLPAAFVEVVERACAVDPMQRFQSAGSFEAALARFLGRHQAAPPPWLRTWWLAAAAVAVIGLVAAKCWSDERASRSAPPLVTVQAPATNEARAAQPSTYRIE